MRVWSIGLVALLGLATVDLAYAQIPPLGGLGGVGGSSGGAGGGGAGAGAGIGAGGGIGGGIGGSADLQSRAGMRIRGGRKVGASFEAQGNANLTGGRGRAGLSTAADAALRTRRGQQPETPPADGQTSDSQTPPQDGGQPPQRRAPVNRIALQADLLLAHRLADIDRLRDVALSRGDAQMLLRCDQLELDARQHHQLQVDHALSAEGEAAAGIHAQGNGVAQVAHEARELTERGQYIAERARQHGYGAARQASAQGSAAGNVQGRVPDATLDSQAGLELSTFPQDPPHDPSGDSSNAQPPPKSPQQQPYPPTAKGQPKKEPPANQPRND
jgi:hypothetical protein